MDGKIVLIYLQTQGDVPQWQGGCILHKTGSNLFETSLFLDTAHHEYFFGDDLITERNHTFFDSVTDCISALALQSSLVLAGMGIEISINFSKNVLDAISSSYSVTRWIAQERLPLPVEHYVEQQIGAVYIYTITSKEEKIDYIQLDAPKN